jgi:hypothetical protein
MYQPQKLASTGNANITSRAGNYHLRGQLLTRSSGNVEIARFGDRRAHDAGKDSFAPYVLSIFDFFVAPLGAAESVDATGFGGGFAIRVSLRCINAVWGGGRKSGMSIRSKRPATRDQEKIQSL